PARGRWRTPPSYCQSRPSCCVSGRSRRQRWGSADCAGERAPVAVALGTRNSTLMVMATKGRHFPSIFSDSLRYGVTPRKGTARERAAGRLLQVGLPLLCGTLLWMSLGPRLSIHNGEAGADVWSPSSFTWPFATVALFAAVWLGREAL